MVVGGEAWVLIEDRHERALGIGLAWMQRSGAGALNVLTNEAAGTLARRAREFSGDIRVWEVHDRNLVAAEPQPHLPEAEPTAVHLEFGPLILDAGADVVIEHGVVGGEVLGLEVCRVVDDAVTGSPRLEVGVGAHDREAFALMHGDTPTTESLKRIVDVVRRHRQPGADPHPLNRLAAERALRSRILAEPSIIGATNLRAASSATARSNVKDPAPCVAVGEGVASAGGDTEPIVAVFSCGIDLDVVPTAADARTWHDLPDARLVIVVPARDASPVTRRLAESLVRPAIVVGVEGISVA